MWSKVERVRMRPLAVEEKGISNLFYFNVLEPFFKVHSMPSISVLLHPHFPHLSSRTFSALFFVESVSHFVYAGTWPKQIADDSDVFALLMCLAKRLTGMEMRQSRWNNEEHKSYRLWDRDGEQCECALMLRRWLEGNINTGEELYEFFTQIATRCARFEVEKYCTTIELWSVFIALLFRASRSFFAFKFLCFSLENSHIVFTIFTWNKFEVHLTSS